jgi:hypothetical protein
LKEKEETSYHRSYPLERENSSLIRGFFLKLGHTSGKGVSSERISFLNMLL